MFARLLLTLSLIGTTTPGITQSYPSRPITFIVPFAAGGSIDVAARQIAGKLGSIVGQRVLVDNKTGAGGTIGMGIAARDDRQN